MGIPGQRAWAFSGFLSPVLRTIRWLFRKATCYTCNNLGESVSLHTASIYELFQCLRIFPNLKRTMVSHSFNLCILLSLTLKINSYVFSGICISSFVYCLPGIFFLFSIEKFKCSDLRVRWPGFKSQLLHLLAEHPWASYLASLCLSSLIC